MPWWRRSRQGRTALDAEDGWQPPLRTPAPVPIPDGTTPGQLRALAELDESAVARLAELETVGLSLSAGGQQHGADQGEARAGRLDGTQPFAEEARAASAVTTG
ncbi:hypothetical protein GPN2_13044 [Streptomyces murinus]